MPALFFDRFFFFFGGSAGTNKSLNCTLENGSVILFSSALPLIHFNILLTQNEKLGIRKCCCKVGARRYLEHCFRFRISHVCKHYLQREKRELLKTVKSTEYNIFYNKKKWIEMRPVAYLRFHYVVAQSWIQLLIKSLISVSKSIFASTRSILFPPELELIRDHSARLPATLTTPANVSHYGFMSTIICFSEFHSHMIILLLCV